MEDQGVLSHQTCLVKKFAFLQLPQKQGNRCAFKWVLITDCKFKSASWTFVKKTVMYNIISKLNSTFGMIGKAKPINWLKSSRQKLKLSLQREEYNLNNMQSCNEARMRNLDLFLLKVLLKVCLRFFPLIMNNTLFLLKFLSRFFHFVAFIWEF